MLSERNRADSLLATYGIVLVTMGRASGHKQKTTRALEQ